MVKLQVYTLMFFFAMCFARNMNSPHANDGNSDGMCCVTLPVPVSVNNSVAILRTLISQFLDGLVYADWDLIWFGIC